MSDMPQPSSDPSGAPRASSLRQLLDRTTPRLAFRMGFFAGSLALAGILFVFLFASRSITGKAGVAANAGSAAAAATDTPSVDVQGTVPPLQADDHVRGDRNAELVLIEYSDFECPFCKRFHGTPQEVVQQNEKKASIAWAYRHYPLPFHENAHAAAEASECVAAQAGNDGFWAFADEYFVKTTSNGNGFPKDQWADLAVQSGATDRAAFEACLSNGTFRANVDAEQAAAETVGISGTPGTIILNTKTGKAKLVSGAYPVETFTAAIDELLVTPSLWDRVLGVFGKKS